jgi:four helix bundle protein
MDYRELGFYQKSREVIKGINLEIKKWPKTLQSQNIAIQLFRAATSIGANIAEGHGRHTGPEYIHYLIIARASANEVDHWLNTAQDCEIGNLKELQRLISCNNETRKMLTSTLDSLYKKQNSSTVREALIPYSPIPYDPEDL